MIDNDGGGDHNSVVIFYKGPMSRKIICHIFLWMKMQKGFTYGKVHTGCIFMMSTYELHFKMYTYSACKSLAPPIHTGVIMNGWNKTT